MEEDFKRDTCAEVALSAMVSMIMILLFSAIVAGMALMMIEQAFMGSRSQSIEQSKTLNSVPYVVAFEIQNLDPVDNTDDRLYLAFKFPYTSDNIEDVAVKWAILGDDGNTIANGAAHATENDLDFSAGDFDLATQITGTGADQNALTEFEPGVYYHIILDLTDPNGNGDYDLREDYGGTLVIAVENGRTTELDFFVKAGATSGYDLMS